MLKRKGNIIIAAILFSMIIINACSVEKRYKVLSFLFDGVPDPGLISDDQNDTIPVTDTVSTEIITDNENMIITYFHQPFQDKECGKCHQNNMGQTMTKQPDLCYSCHDNFEDRYSVLHGPLAGGNCTLCHDPHKSLNDHLLLRESNDICFYCHDETYINQTDIHSIADMSNCLNCHNPHGEENKFLLSDGTCSNCHEDFSQTYTYLHGPVAGGFCNSCHDTHNSRSEHKLLLSGNDLCFKCHKKTDVYKNENHADTEEFNCTECHNPHGGEDKYIFN